MQDTAQAPLDDDEAAARAPTWGTPPCPPSHS